MAPKLDPIDRRIIEGLYANGRQSIEQLAQATGLARSTVHQRVRRLEAMGVITGYRAQINWSSLGLSMVALIQIQVSASTVDPVVGAIKALRVPGTWVEEIHHTIGAVCLELKARAADSLRLEELLNTLRSTPGISSTMTTLVLSTAEPEASPFECIDSGVVDVSSSS